MQLIKICPMCKGKMARKNAPYSFAGVDFGEFDSEVCTKCGEVFFMEEASDLINQKAKELGLWGIGKQTTVNLSGQSLIIRIPKDIVQLYKIQRDSKVLIFPQGKNRICIEV
jgi:hypothetical protein